MRSSLGDTSLHSALCYWDKTRSAPSCLRSASVLECWWSKRSHQSLRYSTFKSRRADDELKRMSAFALMKVSSGTGAGEKLGTVAPRNTFLFFDFWKRNGTGKWVKKVVITKLNSENLLFLFSTLLSSRTYLFNCSSTLTVVCTVAVHIISINYYQ